MKGYTYPGKSPVKAKIESVSNPDKTLIAAGKALGSSYIPMAVDYKLESTSINISDKKTSDNPPKENPKTSGVNPDNKTGKVTVRDNETGKLVTVPAEDRYTYNSKKSRAKRNKKKEKARKRERRKGEKKEKKKK